jgi:type I restriction enzyme S subunit
MKLSEFCAISSGGTPSRDKLSEYFGGSIPWVKSGELREKSISRTEETLTELGLQNSTAKYFPKHTVLVAMYGATVGRTAILEIESTTNQAVAGIIPDKAVADYRYLFHFLRFYAPKLVAAGVGGAQPNISQEILKNIDVPLPPLPIQTQIVAILDKADAAREKRGQANQLTEQFLQSAFLEMFGDPVTNPRRWEKRILKDCITEKPNNGFFAKSHHYHKEGVPIIWISDFIDRFYSNTTGLKRVRLKEQDIPKYEVKYGDVLFCRSSLNYAGVGKAGIIPRECDGGTIYECHIIRLRLDTNRIIPEFFRQLSDLPSFRSQIEKHAKTATMTTISQDGITDCCITVPPLEAQQKFAVLVDRVESLRAKQRESEQELDNLFNSLMQRAFRGELVV